jgi:hypothetical protein
MMISRPNVTRMGVKRLAVATRCTIRASRAAANAATTKTESTTARAKGSPQVRCAV